MAEHDLYAVAFPKLDEAQLAQQIAWERLSRGRAKTSSPFLGAST
jgi:hypothetical protein